MQGATSSPVVVAPEVAKKVRVVLAKEDPEMRAMKHVNGALSGLSQAACLRVLRWALGRVEDRGYIEAVAGLPPSGVDPRPLGADQPR